MGVNVSGGSLDFASTLDNSDFQAKSLQDLLLIKQRLELTGDISGIAKYDDAVKAALASETTLRASLAKIISDAKAQTADFAAELQKKSTDNINNIEAETEALRKRNVEFSDAKTIPDSRTGAYETGSMQSIDDSSVLIATKSLEEYRAELLAVESAISQLNGFNEKGTVSTEVYASSIANLTEREAGLKLAIENYNVSAVQQSATTKATTEALAEEIGIVEGLKAALKQLNAENKTIVDPDKLAKSNALIEETEADLKRAGNAGKAGYDSLGNALENASGKSTKFEAAISRATNLSNIGATIVSRLSRQIIGLGVGFLSFAIGAKLVEVLGTALASFFDILKGGESALQLNHDLLKKSSDIYADQAVNVNLLVKEINDSNTSQERQIEILAELNKTSPTYFGNLKDVKDIITALPEAYKKYNDALLLNSRIEAGKSLITEKYKTLLEAQNKLVELNGKAVGKDFASQFAQTLQDLTNIAGTIDLSKNVKIDGLAGLTDPTAKALAKQVANTQKSIDLLTNGVIDDQIKLQKNGGDIAGKGLATAKKNAENVLEIQKIAVQSHLDSQVAITQDQKKAFADRQTALKASLADQLSIIDIGEKQKLAKIGLSETDSKVIVAQANADKKKAIADYYKNADNLDKKASKQAPDPARAILASQTSLIEQLDALKEKYSSKNKSRDEQEQDAVIADFKKRGELIDAQNKKYADYIKTHSEAEAKAKGLMFIDPKQLAPEKTDALAGLAGEQALVQTKIQVEKQKSIFKEYEDFKLKAGTDAANKLYGAQIGGFTSYIDYLKSLQPTEEQLGSDDPYVKAKANALNDYLKVALPAALNGEFQQQQRQLQSLILQNQSYQQQRATLIATSNEQIASLVSKGYTEQAAQAQINYEEQLTAQDEANFKKLASYRLLFNNIAELTKQQTQDNINNLYDHAVSGLITGIATNGQQGLTPEAFAAMLKQLNTASLTLKNSGTPQTLNEIGSAFGEIANEVGKLNSTLGGLLTAVSSSFSALGKFEAIGNQLAQFGKQATLSVADQAQKTQDLVSAYATAATGVIQIISTITTAAANRKAAELAYYDAVLASQNQYNLSLIDQIRLQEQLNANVFLKDYKNDILDASKALAKANEDYTASLGTLAAGKAKSGQRNAVDPKSLFSGAAGGAAAGAAIGAIAGGGVLSVPAAAAGAVIGGVVGLLSGLFGGKKKEDVFAPLLQEFPELISKTGEFNEALAKNLIQNNLVDDSTKTLLQNTIALNDERQAAIDQINGDIADLAGSLGEDLRSSLVQAFEDGTDAAKAFGGSVSKVIENIVSQFLFEDIFGSQFQDLENNMKISLGVGGDGNIVDDLTSFFDTAGKLVPVFDQGLQAYKDAAAASGIDIFQPSDTSAADSTSTLSNSIKGITESTADVLAGQVGGLRLAQLASLDEIKASNDINRGMFDLATQNLDYVMKIEANTFRTANNTDVLSNIDKSLSSIDKKTGAGASSLAANGLK